MQFFTLVVNAVSAVQNALLRWKNKLALAVKFVPLARLIVTITSSGPTGPIMKTIPPFHLLLASGILATGMETSKVVRLFNALKIPNVQRRELQCLAKRTVCKDKKS